MNPHLPLMVLMVVAMVTGAHSNHQDNKLDYGDWNYREGVDRVNVASVRSLTKVLDAWGKGIFKEIKTLLLSKPNTLLPDYSRVRPLSETINDLFREVIMLHQRITELSHRLATMEPFFRHHGYSEERLGDDLSLGRQSLTGEVASLARYKTSAWVRASPEKASRLVRRRRVKVLNNGDVMVVHSAQ
uniref:Si:ch211-243a20.3 n=1 Tax=Hippocampus comes TaxID=109280 RepID=A0A3Q2Z2A4_HIPCM